MEMITEIARVSNRGGGRRARDTAVHTREHRLAVSFILAGVILGRIDMLFSNQIGVASAVADVRHTDFAAKKDHTGELSGSIGGCSPEVRVVSSSKIRGTDSKGFVIKVPVGGARRIIGMGKPFG